MSAEITGPRGVAAALMGRVEQHLDRDAAGSRGAAMNVALVGWIERADRSAERLEVGAFEGRKPLEVLDPRRCSQALGVKWNFGGCAQRPCEVLCAVRIESFRLPILRF